MRLRGVACAVAVAALTACGGSGGTHGRATLWITRDEGAKVLLVRSVPAGETALQALERSAKVSTRWADASGSKVRASGKVSSTWNADGKGKPRRAQVASIMGPS